MPLVSLQDKDTIERFLRRNVFLHLYGIGDLDDFFWPRTTWHGLEENGELRAIVLIYSGEGLPTLLALSDEAGHSQMVELLSTLVSGLPAGFYAHLSPGLEKAFAGRFALLSHGAHRKMGLMDLEATSGIDTSAVVRLSPAALPAIRELYERAYPGNWFEPRMLETDQYFGVWEAERLISAAGVHVYSKSYRVAALGNIATLPELRGRGYATVVTARLCRSLLRDVDHIGLNVKADNHAATRCYKRLGFREVAAYGEYEARSR